MANADQLAAEMQAFYPRYLDSFNGDDQSAYVANFSFPCVLLGGKQAVSVVNDAATWATMMTNTKAIMRSKGWARTGIEKNYAWPTAPDMGLLMSDFLRYRSDGSVLMNRVEQMPGQSPRRARNASQRQPGSAGRGSSLTHPSRNGD